VIRARPRLRLRLRVIGCTNLSAVSFCIANIVCSNVERCANFFKTLTTLLLCSARDVLPIAFHGLSLTS